MAHEHIFVLSHCFIVTGQEPSDVAFRYYGSVFPHNPHPTIWRLSVKATAGNQNKFGVRTIFLVGSVGNNIEIHSHLCVHSDHNNTHTRAYQCSFVASTVQSIVTCIPTFYWKRPFLGGWGLIQGCDLQTEKHGNCNETTNYKKSTYRNVPKNAHPQKIHGENTNKENWIWQSS